MRKRIIKNPITAKMITPRGTPRPTPIFAEELRPVGGWVAVAAGGGAEEVGCPEIDAAEPEVLGVALAEIDDARLAVLCVTLAEVDDTE